MNKTTVCYACKAKKVLMGMGGIMRECYVCKGIGHVEALHVVEEPKADTQIKKRGRPPKQLEEVSSG